MEKARETFGSRFTFVMALAGSAIGLGNIWRFPYMVGENGGAAFILIYIICSLILSIPIFLSESLIGKLSRRNGYEAFNVLAPGTRWSSFALIPMLGSFVIISYYSVVGGWSIDYFFGACTASLNAETQEQAQAVFASSSTVAWRTIASFTAFLGITALITALGVKKGIETFSKVTMPILFILIVVMAVYSCTLPGAAEGVRYLFNPDFSKVTGKTIADAMGQSFYSMSLGMGTVLTYSSYAKEKDSLRQSSLLTAFFDMLFAIIAGIVILPAVFAAGLAPSSGPSLVFETLPFIFTKMGDSAPVISTIITLLFFLTILIAALSSSISILEVCVCFISEKFTLPRSKASIATFAFAWMLGALCALSFGVLGDVRILGEGIFSFCDKLTSNFFMTFGAMLYSVFVGWKMQKEAVVRELGKTNYYWIKWVIPVLIMIIFISNLLG